MTLDLASSATGYAVIIDGVLDIRTVSESKNMAAWAALELRNYHQLSGCNDTDCDCKINALAFFFPEAKIVAVTCTLSKESVH